VKRFLSKPIDITFLAGIGKNDDSFFFGGGGVRANREISFEYLIISTNSKPIFETALGWVSGHQRRLVEKKFEKKISFPCPFSNAETIYVHHVQFLNAHCFSLLTVYTVIKKRCH
jgi:hypothetical protein